MGEFDLNRQVFDKDQFKKTVDTEFNQLSINSELNSNLEFPKIDEFFSLYQQLFFEIPKEGDVNSHEFIVKQSGDYIDFQKENETIQALLDEILSLREENLNLNKRLLGEIS